jgi:hypothetical protein
MKIKKYTQIVNEGRWDDDDSLFGRPNYPGPGNEEEEEEEDDEFYDDKGYKKLTDDEDYSEYEEEDDDEEDDGQLGHLLYLLRLMFKNTGVEVEITNDDLDISIVAFMNEKERLTDVIRVFEVAKKLKRDTLAQYDSEFEIWYGKDGRPMLNFNFYYGDGLDDDNSPF